MWMSKCDLTVGSMCEFLLSVELVIFIPLSLTWTRGIITLKTIMEYYDCTTVWNSIWNDCDRSYDPGPKELVNNHDVDLPLDPHHVF